MAPARGHDAVVEPCTPCQPRLCCVAEDADPFVKGHADRVERTEIVDEAVIDLLLLHFRHEGAEDLVPDDEHARVISVVIWRGAPLIDAAMRRSFHPRLAPAVR